MELAEVLPAGAYTCWRVCCTTQMDASGWTTDTSPPYLTRGGAFAAASQLRDQIDQSRGRALASPWRQVNVASSQNVLMYGEPQEGDVVWENTHGETVTVERSTLIVGG